MCTEYQTRQERNTVSALPFLNTAVPEEADKVVAVHDDEAICEPPVFLPTKGQP